MSRGRPLAAGFSTARAFGASLAAPLAGARFARLRLAARAFGAC
jgi:hypothetical protein